MRSNLKAYCKYFAETGQLVYEKNRKSCRKPYKMAKASSFVQYLETAIKVPDAVCGKAKREGILDCPICYCN